MSLPSFRFKINCESFGSLYITSYFYNRTKMCLNSLRYKLNEKPPKRPEEIGTQAELANGHDSSGSNNPRMLSFAGCMNPYTQEEFTLGCDLLISALG